MASGLTPSETFVAKLCHRSFLKLWTHPNPIGKKGKELCDCLIVCGPDIVIISVKEINYKDTGDRTGWDRWNKAAIEKSTSQILGAERWLDSASCFSRRDGRVIVLPAQSDRKYHRVSVSLGGRGEVPLQWGDAGNGFIHVVDEYSLTALFSELDTITDFIRFLTAIEALIRGGTKPLFSGGGLEDLLAVYIENDKAFGFDLSTGERPDLLVVEAGIWKHLLCSREYQARKDDLVSSYAWDRMIDLFAVDLLTGGLFDMHSKEVTTDELALVAMARQPRGYRAQLADALIDFHSANGADSCSRVVVAYNATAFVFLAGKSSDRDIRAQELVFRCLTVRGRCPNITTVVGIATDRPGSSDIGYSSDLVYMHMQDWHPEDEEIVSGIQRDLGFFKNVQWTK